MASHIESITTPYTDRRLNSHPNIFTATPKRMTFISRNVTDTGIPLSIVYIPPNSSPNIGMAVSAPRVAYMTIVATPVPPPPATWCGYRKMFHASA